MSLAYRNDEREQLPLQFESGKAKTNEKILGDEETMNNISVTEYETEDKTTDEDKYVMD